VSRRPPTLGDALKGSGMDLVLTNTPAVWTMHATAALKFVLGSIKTYVELTEQEFRIWYITQGGGREPPNPNAWGAFWHKMVTDGVIVHTGRYTKAIIPQSHSRIIGIFRKP
jgi:hypothetical protein